MKKSIFKRLFNGQNSQGKTTKIDLSPLKRDLKVLVVDDSRTQLRAIEKMLNSLGIKITTAENGKQGILMARHQRPDLILMDIVMPEINGFQATRYLTRQQETSHIPIIIISGSDQESDKAWGLKLGARDYLSKPIDKEELINAIARVLSQNTSTASPEASHHSTAEAV